MPRRTSHIVDLAKRGAEARLVDLEHEIKLLLRLFPDLRDSFDQDELPLPFILARSAGRGRRQAARRRSTPASVHRGASKRLTSYWAGRKGKA